MSVNSFGNKIFSDVIKLRRGNIGLGWALNPMIGALIRIREIWRRGKTHTEGQSPCHDGSRD